MDFNEARVDEGAVASAGPSLQTDNYASTSSLNFYRSDALPDVQPTVSTH